MSGHFITCEGIEGSGKSTQITQLTEYLQSKDLTVCLSKEPGGTPVGEKIRQLLLDPENEICATAELYLYEASRAHHVKEVIRPALERGEWVLCDRFYDATVAYQGYARGLSLEWLHRMNQEATGGLAPELTLLFDCPVEVGLQRATQENGPDRLEQESLDFHAKVREGYFELAREEPDRFVVIDTDRSVDAIFEEVCQAFTSRYGLES